MESGHLVNHPHPRPVVPSPTRGGGGPALFRVACYLVAPIAFWLIPTARIESGPSVCLIRRVFGVPCPGCGMTRALSCAVHGHPRRAIAYNNRVIVVLPLLIMAWLRGLRLEWQAFQTARVTSDYSGSTRSR